MIRVPADVRQRFAEAKKCRRPTAIDLFCGAGGLSLGFEQAGFDVVGAVDLDPVHCAVHQYNFPKTPVFSASVSTVDPETILAACGVSPGQLDVVFGGPPCQGFSFMGRRNHDDARNTLVFSFLRFVQAARPRYFVMENVPGMLAGSAREYVDLLVSEAEASGYTVVQPIRVLKALDFGVPQDRRRVFVLGYRRDSVPVVYPKATHVHSLSTVVPKFGSILPRTPTVFDAIGDLPDIDGFESLIDSDRLPMAVQYRHDHGTLAAYRRESDPRLSGCMRSNHSEQSRRRFAETEEGTVEPVSRFFKLAWAGYCNTLRAGTGTDRGAFTSPRPIHPAFARCISVREAARLHGYPDWFSFHVTKWHGFRQIGNSVPPPLGRAVASAVVSALGLAPRLASGSIDSGDESLRQMTVSSASELLGLADEDRPKRTR